MCVGLLFAEVVEVSLVDELGPVDFVVVGVELLAVGLLCFDVVVELVLGELVDFASLVLGLLAFLVVGVVEVAGELLRLVEGEVLLAADELVDFGELVLVAFVLDRVLPLLLVLQVLHLVDDVPEPAPARLVVQVLRRPQVLDALVRDLRLRAVLLECLHLMPLGSEQRLSSRPEVRRQLAIVQVHSAHLLWTLRPWLLLVPHCQSEHLRRR